MCLTSDAAYRTRDADAIFRIERKDDQKIAQNSKLFYRKYFEFATNHSGSVRSTLWRIVSKYILCFYAWFSHFTLGTCRTRRITLRAPRKITTDHDMRPIPHGRIRRAEPSREASCWVVVYFVLELCPQTNGSNLGCQLSPRHVTAER